MMHLAGFVFIVEENKSAYLVNKKQSSKGRGLLLEINIDWISLICLLGNSPFHLCPQLHPV